MNATTRKEFKAKSGKVIPAGARVSVISLYLKDAVVDYNERDQHTWFRVPRKILAGIPTNAVAEK